MPIQPLALTAKALDTGSLINTLASMRKMQSAAQQQQMNQMAIEKAQREQQRADAFRNALASGAGASPEGMQRLMGIDPSAAIQLQDMLTKQQQAKKDALKTDLDLFGKIAGSLPDTPENYRSLYDDAVKTNPMLQPYLPKPETYKPGMMSEMGVSPALRYQRETAGISQKAKREEAEIAAKAKIEAAKIRSAAQAPAQPTEGIPSERVLPPEIKSVVESSSPTQAQQLIDYYNRKKIENLFKEKTDKPLTESQGKATTFALRMKEANKILEDFEKEGTFTPSALRSAAEKMPFIGGGLGAAAGFVAESGDEQRIRQARENFITAVLRQESGAVIGQEEFDREERKYFPQIGDTPETIKQKRKARQLAIDAMSYQAGPGKTKVKEFNPEGIGREQKEKFGFLGISPEE